LSLGRDFVLGTRKGPLSKSFALFFGRIPAIAPGLFVVFLKRTEKVMCIRSAHFNAPSPIIHDVLAQYNALMSGLIMTKELPPIVR
jgi:hypothetical protein